MLDLSSRLRVRKGFIAITSAGLDTGTVDAYEAAVRVAQASGLTK